VWQTTEDKSRLLHFAALGFFFVAPLRCATAYGIRKNCLVALYGTTEVVPYTCLNVDAKSLIVK
jgi:hypothetical protein